MVEVVAALIEEGGNIMICQRPADKPQPLLWEFPGGKVEKNETPQQALIRECAEELNIEIEVQNLFGTVEYTYPERVVRLSLYCAKMIKGTPKLQAHIAMKWVTKQELLQYDFCPADLPFLEKLQQCTHAL